MKNKVDISVVIIALNEEKYIETCLKSLKKQDIDKKYEIIVVDGGSTDKTRDIAKKYADKVLIYKKRNIPAARNFGIRKSSGWIIVPNDADTYFESDWLRRLTEPFFDKSDIVFVGGSQRPIENLWFRHLIYKIGSVYLRGFVNFFGLAHYSNTCMAFKRDIFNKVGGYDIKFQRQDDCILSFKISKFGKVKFLPNLYTFISTRRYNPKVGKPSSISDISYLIKRAISDYFQVIGLHLKLIKKTNWYE
jgi:glycosyltransferase involved in cell wall biosynthesis